MIFMTKSMKERLAKIYDSIMYGHLGDVIILVGSVGASFGLLYIALCPKCRMIKA